MQFNRTEFFRVLAADVGCPRHISRVLSVYNIDEWRRGNVTDGRK
jgi:hypothetical protein